jgi:hypothetical protein
MVEMSKKPLVTEQESNDSAPTPKPSYEIANAINSVTVRLLRQQFGVVQ